MSIPPSERSAAPLVSVLISSYNRAQLLEESVRSVMAQSYQNLQIIIADDGSTDNSIEVARRLAAEDVRIVLALAPENQGMSANYNAGLERCTGDFIAILAGDDLMLPDKVEKQVRFLLAHPECGLCTHDLESFQSETGEALYRWSDRWDAHSGGLEVVFDTQWFFGRSIKYNLSSVFGPALVLKSRPWDTRLRFWNDWMWMTDCLASTKTTWGHIPEVLGQYRVHQQQLSQSPDCRNYSLEEQMMVIAIAAARYPELGKLIPEKRKFILFKHVLYHWVPPEKQADFEHLFHSEAGTVRWAWMKLCQWIVAHPQVMDLTRTARKMARFLLNPPCSRGARPCAPADSDIP